MKNTFENKVVKTDEDYNRLQDDLTCWYVGRVVSLILIGALISMSIFWNKLFSPFINSNLVDCPFLAWLLDLVFILLMFILGVATHLFHSFQSSAKREIDEIFDPDGVPWYFQGIITSKGIRLAQREMRRYRRQKRLREKEYKERQKEFTNENSNK